MLLEQELQRTKVKLQQTLTEQDFQQTNEEKIDVPTKRQQYFEKRNEQYRQMERSNHTHVSQSEAVKIQDNIEIPVNVTPKVTNLI